MDKAETNGHFIPDFREVSVLFIIIIMNLMSAFLISISDSKYMVEWQDAMYLFIYLFIFRLRFLIQLSTQWNVTLKCFWNHTHISISDVWIFFSITPFFLHLFICNTKILSLTHLG